MTDNTQAGYCVLRVTHHRALLFKMVLIRYKRIGPQASIAERCRGLIHYADTRKSMLQQTQRYGA
jgi:hypothetical protein